MTPLDPSSLSDPAGSAEPTAPLSAAPEVSDGARRDDSEPGKEGRKAKKKKKKNARPWQRYEALIDALKESQDQIDLADHKARFALLIMGALNAAIIVLGTSSDLLWTLPSPLKLWLYIYFVVYALIAIYFLFQAIESLRPRSVPDRLLRGADPEDEASLGLRFFVGALRYDLPAYLDAWQSVRVGQLNTELVTQLHALARINKAKYIAVANLYAGLQAITFLTAGLLVALGVAGFVEYRGPLTRDLVASSEASAEGVAVKGGRPGQSGWAILGEPERLAAPGVREPSGIVYAPSSDTLFVVGDEGSLVEVDTQGRLITRFPVRGNLEDVAVHTPSGRLVLLEEQAAELIVFDPVSRRETARFKLDSTAVLGTATRSADRNQGFEGLAFRPDATQRGGGVFYLVHQRDPALMVSLVFDPLGPSGDIGAGAVLTRSPIGSRVDLTAVTYDASLDRLFVIADSRDRIAVLGLNSIVDGEIILPGAQQEGLTFDALGHLWIADDRAGLLLFRGARERIAEAMKTSLPNPGNPALTAS